MTKKKSWCLISIIIILLQLPMMWNHSVNLGGDTLFHYNRIYDAAMQLKNSNFQPLYSYYGFNGTLRVINAVYSPVLAYILGGISLISRSWFNFDIIVNCLLGLSISTALWRMFNLQKVPNNWRVLLIGIVLSSNNYVSWLLQHQFNAIGAVPLILIVTLLIRMYKEPKEPIKLIELSCSMALVIQVHMLSTLLALFILIPLTIVATYWWHEKLKSWFNIIKAMILTLLLTANIWVPYLYLTRNNNIQTPGIEQMSSNVTHFFENQYAWNGTVNWAVSLVMFIMLVAGLTLWAQTNTVTRAFTVIGWILLILQTNVVPWDQLLHHWPAIAVIQFPFRFGFLLIIVIIALIGEYITSYEKIDTPRIVITLFAVLVVNGLLITYNSIWQWNVNFNSNIASNIVRNPSNSQIGSTIDAKKAFLSNELQSGILKASRGSTDYLTGTNKDYFHYNEAVFLTNKAYTKNVFGSKEILSWQSITKNDITVPIAVYKGLSLKLNGKSIPVKKDELGLAVVHQINGKNKLVAQQVTPLIILCSYYLTAGTWTIIMAVQYYKWKKRSIIN